MKYSFLSVLTIPISIFKTMNGNNKKKNKKTDFQIGMDESKTYYRLIKKQEAPKQPSGYAVKKNKMLSGNM